jgi:hypothetical protein
MKPLSEVAPFWMVHVFGKPSPTKRHPTRGSAHAEAERLASLNPDVTVVVLESTDLVRRNTLERHSYVAAEASADPTDDIPF